MIAHLKRFVKFIEVPRIAGIYPGDNPAPNLQHKAEAFVAFGPNVTTFIVPGELFPTRYRSTAHGISAASGKLGAIVSQIIFFEVQETNTLKMNTLRAILGIFVGVTLTGIASTSLLEETVDQSLEVLSFEPQQGHVQGVVEVELQDGIIHRRGFPRQSGNP
ncbi:hypothetical protein BGW80DRAFT_1446110 [Lactifluus volemus]|nr:hypothetical protein BGW80DRAFT_1446110 [Lactifluus volemus]